jgi:NAD(P)-dependent dehydrogenase (short-subunit alcohol dehydrogenase family)
VADSHSVASEEGAAAIVQTALQAFGGVDILINNAGISIAAPFDEMTPRDFRRHIDINLMGSLWTCRAVWPHMRSKGYGRIVNTTSGALTGVTWLAAYSASKGGLLSLTRSLAAEGAALGIKVNAINPGAFTRMVAAQQENTSPMYQHAQQNLPPELVSPVAAFLAHENCPASGECIDSVGGQVQRTYLAQTAGFTDRQLTIDTVARRWQEVMAGSAASLIPAGAFDPTQWDIRQYRPGPGSGKA